MRKADAAQTQMPDRAMVTTCPSPVNKGDQHQEEISTSSFVVKVWIEPPEQAGDERVWRGHITHVPEGNRKYVRNLSEITAFIALYLKVMGVNSSIWQRIKKRLWR